MNLTDRAVRLDDFEHLFRDRDSFLAFVDALSAACQRGASVLFSGHKLIGTVLSTNCTKEFLAEKFIQKVAERPELLKEIADRLENDEVVE